MMRAFERLYEYTRINTTSCEAHENVTPSGAGEAVLAARLCEEMAALGLENVRVDEHAYAYGFLPATPGKESCVPLGLIAHLDTVDDCGGTDTNAQIIRNYDGRPIALGRSGKALDPEMFPHLKDCMGKTILTTDGTSVLGADDKAGIAEIMTLLEQLIRKKIPHGPLSVCFTPDEEIGHGAALLDLEKFGARLAYTCDGGAPEEIEYETFNAAKAVIHIEGLSVHPGSAKDKMINALLVAAELNSLLPADEIPAKTEGRQGFYHLTELEGSVSSAVMHYILRDHDSGLFEQRKQKMLEIAETLDRKYGSGTVRCEMTDQYRNMAQIVMQYPQVLRAAEEAIRKAGLDPVSSPVRGGTDGAQLSYRGLPCPNLGTGSYAHHGLYEHAVAEEMDKCVEILLNIVSQFAE